MVVSIGANLGEAQTEGQGEAMAAIPGEQRDFLIGVICAKSGQDSSKNVLESVRAFVSKIDGDDVLHRAILFCEPSASANLTPGSVPDALVIRWPTIRGAMGNWMSALHGLYVEDPRAKFYVILEDDIVVPRGLAAYIRKTVSWQQAAVLSPYCAAVDCLDVEPGDWQWFRTDVPEKHCGSLCLVLTNSAARMALQSAELLDAVRVTAPAAIDERVGVFCRQTGIRLWRHGPSLIQHRGDGSERDKAKNRMASDFPGADAIAKRLSRMGDPTGHVNHETAQQPGARVRIWPAARTATPEVQPAEATEATYPQDAVEKWLAHPKIESQWLDGTPKDVAIIVTLHETADIAKLRQAVASAMYQTERPKAIIVECDGDKMPWGSAQMLDELMTLIPSAGHKFYVEPVKGKRGVIRSRNAGMELAAMVGCRYAVCLDYDDILPRNYVEVCREQMRRAEAERRIGQPAVAVVYSDFVWFQNRGEAADPRGKPGEKSRNDRGTVTADMLATVNVMHCSSMVRIDAWRTAWPVGEEYLPDDCNVIHNDWWMWRRIMAQGCVGIFTGETFLWYRISPGSQMEGMNKASGDDMRLRHFVVSDCATQPVQIVLPLSGRWEHWEGQSRLLLAAVNDPTNRYRRIHITAVISGGASSFFCNAVPASLLRICNGRELLSFEVLHVGVNGKAADANRREEDVYKEVQGNMIRLWSRIKSVLRHEFVFVLEDDIFPERADVINRLLRGFDFNTASVGGVYRSRYTESYVAWYANQPPLTSRKASGVESIGGTGWGCIMVRRSALNATLMSFEGCGNFDITFAKEMRAIGLSVCIDWEVPCRHAALECGPVDFDISNSQGADK